MSFEPEQIKTNFESPVSFQETVNGSVSKMLFDILTSGAVFNAKVYEGTPNNYVRYKRLHDCFFVMEAADRDAESRSQVLVISGTLSYHYFGQDTYA